ncbi:MAG: prepilin-type N-terminal cleavage/methylation domain-containing protein [Gemmatimonadota bacterium]|nr:prepilin-type N-terminal cleavage/methylation domain-containing protein [Gemmatimonadota bacterium]
MKSRRGMSLIEIMIAISLLAIVIASLGAMSVSVAHTSFSVNGSSFVNAELTRQMNRLMVLPFDSLPADSGSVAVAATPYAYQRQMTLTDITATDRAIQLILRPTNTLVRPETVQFNRTRPIASPLNQ